MKVVLYQFEGTYAGNASVEYRHPQLGGRHSGILFLRQDSPAADWTHADNVLRSFGFASVEAQRSGTLEIESLNASNMRVLAGHYEEAMQQGESLVWYP